MMNIKNWVIIVIIGSFALGMTAINASADRTDENTAINERHDKNIDIMDEVVIAPAPENEELIIAPSPDTTINHDVDQGKRENIISPEFDGGNGEYDSEMEYTTEAMNNQQSKISLTNFQILGLAFIVATLGCILFIIRRNKVD
jgi:hypothetical protein